MHWSKISLAMLRALSLAGVIGILLVSGGTAFAQNVMGHGHGHKKQVGVKTARIVNTIHPIIVRKKHHRHEHWEDKHRYPYPGRIRGPLPPVHKPPPSMQGGMPAPGGAAPAPGGAAPAPGGAAPAPGGAAPAPGGAAPAPGSSPTPGGGRDPARPPTRAQ